MVPDIPSPLLRSFVAVVDCGSLAAASLRIGRSESAISLQMSRLEDIIGQRVFDRDGRALKLNLSGGLLLSHARVILGRIDAARADLDQANGPPIRMGIVQDFVDSILRPTLADVRASGAGASPMTIIIGSTSELLQALSDDRIDSALCAGEVIGGTFAASLPMKWFGNADLLSNDVLPLIGITPPCPFLKAAQQALDAIGRPWRVTLATPSLDGLRAAVEAGLGLTCRTEAGLKLSPLVHPALPDLPEISYSVTERRKGKTHSNIAAQRMAEHLAMLAPDLKQKG